MRHVFRKYFGGVTPRLHTENCVYFRLERLAKVSKMIQDVANDY